MSLKEGQKVKCISVNTTGSKFQIKEGKKYTIKKVMTAQGQEVVTLKENNVDEKYFFASRFEPVEDKTGKENPEDKKQEAEKTSENPEDKTGEENTKESEEDSKE